MFLHTGSQGFLCLTYIFYFKNSLKGRVTQRRDRSPDWLSAQMPATTRHGQRKAHSEKLLLDCPVCPGPSSSAITHCLPSDMDSELEEKQSGQVFSRHSGMEWPANTSHKVPAPLTLFWPNSDPTCQEVKVI